MFSRDQHKKPGTYPTIRRRETGSISKLLAIQVGPDLGKLWGRIKLALGLL